MKLGDLIRRQRGLQAMSFQDVALAAGNFTRSFAHSVEHGRTTDVRVSDIMGFARAFRLPPEVIFAAAMESHDASPEA